MGKKKQYDIGFDDGVKQGWKEARDMLVEQADELREKNDLLQAKQDEMMAELRLVDAALWGAVDTFSADWHKWLTRDRDDIASYRVKGRVATGVTISYDDGYAFHTARRIGGLSFRPQILHFEHSDPNHVGSIHEAVQYYTTEAVLDPDPTEEEKDGTDL
jgi:hypothetical protein